MFALSLLWKAPQVNPINGKARSVPVFNVVNMYGRVFFFSWMGFLIAFWSWCKYKLKTRIRQCLDVVHVKKGKVRTDYHTDAFPPLLTKTIKADLHLSQKEVANSNIVSLVATLVVRFIAGPLCDRFGPRKVFAGLLLTGAIPTALAGTVKNATGLITLRFFVGILGGTFVPCQVWSMQFFDKNVVGSANALIGGWGNSGVSCSYDRYPRNILTDNRIGWHYVLRYACYFRLSCQGPWSHPTRRLEGVLHCSFHFHHDHCAPDASPLS